MFISVTLTRNPPPQPPVVAEARQKEPETRKPPEASRPSGTEGPSATVGSSSLARAAAPQGPASPIPTRVVVGVAIYPFAAKGGADTSLAEGLTSLFTNEVASSSCVRIVAEDVIRDLAKQQGLEQQCGTEMCQIDIAKQAKADILVRGDIARVDVRYYLMALVIDLKTQRTLFTEDEESDRDSLPQHTKQLGRRVATRLGCNETINAPAP